MIPLIFRNSSWRRRFGRLIALLPLAASPLCGQTLANPGFETDSFSGPVAANTPITGWTTTTPTLVGLNAFADNGTPPEGSLNVAFLETGGNLKATISDLNPGGRYKVNFRVNASSQGTPFEGAPFLSFSTDASPDATLGQVTPVTGSFDYRAVSYEFTATGTSQQLTIANTRASGTHILLVDSFSVELSTGAWTVSPWTGDADSEISADYAYTHALNFNYKSGVVVNGVPFVGSTTTNAGITPKDVEYIVPGRLSVDQQGGAGTFSPVPSVTGTSLELARNYRGGNLIFSVGGLKPDAAYVANFYMVGIELPTAAVPHRTMTFASYESAEKITVDQNRYGQGQGIRVQLRYTTDSSGTATISVTALSPVGFRCAAFANRDAEPFAGTTGWSSAAWNDDASSGIDGNYRYTHAYSFNSDESATVNGVTFRGLSGDNPSDDPHFFTNRLTGLGTDTNGVTGDSAQLAGSYYGTNTPNVYILNGLEGGREYVSTLYSVGQDATRPILFVGTAGGKPMVIDQDQFGIDKGIRIEYRYVAPASGTVVLSASSFDGSKLFGAYALSNREAQPLAGAPSITFDPASAAIAAGSDHTFDVSATGGSLAYQWFFNDVPLPRATGSAYTVTNAGPENAGDYRVKVTNPSGEITSASAVLQVLSAVPGLFDTGAGWDGLALAVTGAMVDPHYTVVQNPDSPESVTAFVQTAGIPGAWLANGATSQWIGPRADTSGAAEAFESPYLYRIEFSLPGFDPSSVKISGKWAADNIPMEIRVNGTPVGLGNFANGFSAFVPFTIDADLLAAKGAFLHTDGEPNTLDFVVRNDTAGSTGLMVRDLTGLGEILAETAPTFIRQPAGVTLTSGQTTVLGAVASGSGRLAYQWRKDGVDLPGATRAYLAVPAEAVTYTVVVANDVGSVTSEGAAVTVASGPAVPPTALTLVLAGGSASGSFTGTPGASYVIQRSTTLAAGDWQDLETIVAPASGIVNVVDSDPPTGRAFYRISYQP